MNESLDAIFTFRRLSERIATSGQPTADQFAAIADAGFEVVINLAMPDDEDHLPDERATVEALGMVYRPIPVVWAAPTLDDLSAFFYEMARWADRRVYVHCVANYRVSAFMYLYRTLVLGEAPDYALADLHTIWQPYDWWQAFIDNAVARWSTGDRDKVSDTLRVHMAETPEPEILDYLNSILDDRVVLTTGNPPELADYTVLVDGEPTREKLQAAPNLHAVIQPYTGVSPETAALMREFPRLTLYNSHGPALPTAEMAFALLLAAAKAIIPLDRALREDDWSPRRRPIPSVLLSGKTALLLGYGAIGRHVARMCRGMAMDVLAVRRAADPGSDELAQVFPVRDLHNLLPRAGALIISLPLTDETRGMVGARELALLPAGAVLVNVGRGPVVDEAALYAALKDGTLGAAGIDVWYTYPDDDAARHTPPSAYPFGELDNVVMSPHRGGLAYEEDQQRERMSEIAEILNALARGEEAPNRVDLTLGY